MIDKSLVKNRFKKSLITYNDNAIVQKQMAEKLIKLLPIKNYGSIFEIGCATGILTEQIAKTVKYNEIYINDIVPDAKQYIDSILSDYTFISGDIETIDINRKFDLVISNACLQWCNNIKNTINKLMEHLNKDGILAVSVFGDSILKELKEIFDIKENTYSLNDIKQYLKEYNICNITEETFELKFNNLREILQHLKYTGANSLKEFSLTKSSFAGFEEQYKNKYSKNGKLILTYNPAFLIINRNS